jgi:hypothetical protein
VLSLQKCRSLLGTDCNLTDAQLEQLRQQLYAFSEVAIGAFHAQRQGPKSNGSEAKGVSALLTQVPEDERQQVEERAAILEYEAGRKKAEAERQAFGEWVQSKKRASPPRKARSENRRRGRRKKN